MSSITKRANGSYLARWRPVPGGPERSKAFIRKGDAERFLTTVDAGLLAGDYVDPNAGRMTFSVYAAGWLSRKESTVKVSTARTYRAHIDAHLEEAFGPRPLRSITREDVKGWAGGLVAGGLAPTTARAVAFTLAAILREAVDDGRLARNPAERIKVGARTERRVDPMHIAEISGMVPALAAAMPARWSGGVVLMASTGLRLSECLGLTADRVDFLRRTLRVDRQLVDGGGFGPPKTRASVRTVPVPAAVIELLAEHLATYSGGEAGLVFLDAGGEANHAEPMG